MEPRCDESSLFGKLCRKSRSARERLDLRLPFPWMCCFYVAGLDCIAALKALGEETRLRILRPLFKEPLGVSEIS